MPERGRVKWFNNRAGYGFITLSDGRDAYVHHREIAGEGYKALQAGDCVEFTLTEGPLGLLAVRVVRLDPQTLRLTAEGRPNTAKAS
jgi:CspA family cold shock protein